MGIFKLILICSILPMFAYSKNNTNKKDSFFMVGYKAGTLGLGLDLSYAFNRTFVLRTSLNGFSLYKKNLKYEEKEFETQGTLNDTGLLIDMHPWQNAFFFSWGAYKSKSKINLKYEPKSDNIKIGNHKYPAMQIGDVLTSIKLKREVNPYIGFGYNSMDKDSRWNFILDIGVIYIDTPKATINAYASKGFEALQPVLNNESKIESKDLNNKIKKYKLFPVISAGVGYKF